MVSFFCNSLAISFARSTSCEYSLNTVQSSSSPKHNVTCRGGGCVGEKTIFPKIYSKGNVIRYDTFFTGVRREMKKITVNKQIEKFFGIP